jgi:hypothetical protein
MYDPTNKFRLLQNLSSMADPLCSALSSIAVTKSAAQVSRGIKEFLDNNRASESELKVIREIRRHV